MQLQKNKEICEQGRKHTEEENAAKRNELPFPLMISSI
jgi:hypothetical protein